MEALKERIVREGQGIGRGVLKVDSFLNHQIDVAFLDEIGRALAERFAGCSVTKILTVESSGIPVACAVSRAMGYPPVVFAKKAAPNTMVEGVYSTDVKSFTKETVSTIRVSRKFLQPEDRILIIDDFLAYGESALGLTRLVRSAGADVTGIGVVIEKRFQGGSAKLKQAGFQVESLAVIRSITDGNIEFQ
ncbi:MAG: xanthine phosphoribosyltransferase [Bacillota bacterium]|nr:xanthine phosphoribosyltransferase [Eubacteriales bacterium]MDI9491488.1 xanthine phosphoribosyltransferase [Bacillota bacterium]NLV70070.1 xanthine phosphoribosyltransferase [Clostridiales bacterium]